MSLFRASQVEDSLQTLMSRKVKLTELKRHHLQSEKQDAESVFLPQQGVLGYVILNATGAIMHTGFEVWQCC